MRRDTAEYVSALPRAASETIAGGQSRRRARRRAAWTCLCLPLCGLPAALGATVAPPAEAFGTLPQTDHVSISPNGKTLAWADFSAAAARVVMFDVAAHATKRVSRIDPPMKLRDLYWGDDDTLLVAVSFVDPSASGERDRAEFFRLMSVDANTGEAHVMLMSGGFRPNVTDSQVLATYLAGRPKTLIMSSRDWSAVAHRAEIGSRLNDARKDSGWVSAVYAVDTRTGTGKLIEQGTQFTDQWVIDPDGDAVARSEFDPRGNVFRILVKRGLSWHEILHQENQGKFELSGLTADGTAIVALGPSDHGRAKLLALPLDGSAPRVMLEDAQLEVDAVQNDRLSRIPVAAILGGPDPQYRFFDPADQKRADGVARAFPGRRVSIYSESQDKQRVVAYVAGPATPPAFYLVDFKSHRADLIGEEYPALTGAHLGESRAISYKARDGLEIPAYLTLPPGSAVKNMPLVVLPHGGPEARDTPRFDWWAQFLATRGYAVLQPQFRGSSGFGNEFRLAGRRQWGGLMQDDITDGVTFLIQQGIADPHRLCIVGASYGGYAALAGAAFTPDLYACAVSINGVSNLPQMQHWVQVRSGSESDTVGYWRDSIGPHLDPKVIAASPVNAVDRIHVPIMLMVSSDDTVVPQSQSEQMARALQQSGKSVSVVTLQGDDHWLSHSETRVRMLKELDTFLAAQLHP